MIDTTLHFDNTEDKVTVVRTEDVEPYLEHNKTLRSMTQTNTDGMKHCWSAPPVIYEKLFNEYNEGRNPPDLRMFGREFTEYAHKRIMNDPDLKAFRVNDPGFAYRIGWGK